MHKTLNVVTVFLATSALFATGCLSSSHRIGKGELMRLSRTAPQQRGDNVRVVQNLGSGTEPPPAERVNSNTTVIVGSPIWIDGTPHHHGHHHAPAHSGSFPGSKGLAAGKKDAAIALLVLAGIVTVALAATEGARYDGWVKLHPMHPLHLYGPYGAHTVVPLAQLDERTAAWAAHAYVRSEEGPFHHLGRAALDRHGLTFSMLLGTGEVPVIGVDTIAGANSHLQFGYFFNQSIGLQVDFGFGWAEDSLQNTIYTSRTALELQVYPLQAGRFHLGGFGQIGGINRFDDGIAFDDSSTVYGLGALAQFDITTRLALTARLGTTQSFGRWAKEATIGISIF